jgi:hypothetical protein
MVTVNTEAEVLNTLYFKKIWSMNHTAINCYKLYSYTDINKHSTHYDIFIIRGIQIYMTIWVLLLVSIRYYELSTQAP